MTQDSRSIELEVEVPGSPEEVWAAVATGPGIGSWFVPTTVEEREGGEVVQQFGPGDSMTVRGRVLVWDPPRRVVFDGGDADEGLAFEWLVEARDGGICVVRLVNSGFGSGEEWDGQFDGMDAGWRMFMHNLILHCRDFPGQGANAVQAMGMAAGGLDEAWTNLTGALGFPAAPAEGDHIAARPDSPTALAGTVERAVPRMVMLRIHEPGPETALVAVEGSDGQAGISVWFWLYGTDAADRVPAILDGWQAWLADLFPPPV